MRYRTFGRTGWQVSELGYGMWGMAGWTESADEESRQSLRLAADLGCNFFDTAWAYGEGRSERLLGELVRARPGAGTGGPRPYTATKVPPKNRRWPSSRGDRIEDVFPPQYLREYTEKSLANLGLPSVDLLQFHVWEDDWASDEGWQRAVDDLKRQGLIHAVGISLNRWEPWNGLRTLRTGQIDAVQVIYNLFDQAPEDELFPLCRELDIAVIARVPFDEGSLTGTMTNLGIPQLDLLQFHVWEDAWAHDDRWWRAMSSLQEQGLIGGIGISVNRWEPTNVIDTLRTGHVDAVQVIYNIFDQAPADELFPVCRELDIAVIARVPFDEGSLTGTMTRDMTFPEGDWRNLYFCAENLGQTIDHVEALRADVPAGMTMPELALRFILADDRVSTVIPGMRAIPHVRSNIAAGEGAGLSEETMRRMRAHRWDRVPTSWSH